ncbi:MAG: hypothetical protein DIZ80_00310 [endosymbiont of Galathealinum brachiosum]|uniref:Uncharacterized protein n=1 Tax=endosymbiont of Galathealinum brachiosum TaxID=2200906 RepID=A0A370DNK2_9GAMM|nr:MAG: hypothetical protein DIZ80_00310 [endosymbiont of Galathealinum brachiosum]
MDLMHAQAEFEAGHLTGAAAEPSEKGNGWHLLFHTPTGKIEMLTDHSGHERLYHTLKQVTEVGRDIGFESIRVEEHF